MSKSRNKKRLITLVLVFALVFLTGAAFAFTNGILDVVGTVNISAPGELLVVWHTASIGGPPLGYSALGATHTFSIVDRGGPGGLRERQRIVWNITFDGNYLGVAGQSFAGIVARARNASSQTATITKVEPRWVDFAVTTHDGIVPDGDFTPADFGLNLLVSQDHLSGPLAPDAISAVVNLMVTWDRIVPDGFFDGYALGDLVFAGTIVIEFDYELYNP